MPEEKLDVLHEELIPVLMVEGDERLAHTKVLARAAGMRVPF